MQVQSAGFQSLQTTFSERAPLLSSVDAALLTEASADPTGFAKRKAQEYITSHLSFLLAYIPDIESYAEQCQSGQHSTLFILLVELCWLLKCASPLLFNNLQEHSITVAPTVALGQLAAATLAATTIATMLANISAYSLLQGFNSALDTVLAESADAGAARVWCQRAVIISAAALIPIFAVWARAESILLALDQTTEVAALATTSLHITALGLPAYAMNEIIKRYLVSQDLLSVQTPILALVAPLNVALNYILVHGPERLRLGFVGAPLSVAISYNFVTATTLVALVCWTKPSRIARGSDGAGFVLGLKTLLVGGCAGVGRAASEMWARDLGTLAASMLGPTALAAQAVLLAIASTAHQAPLALCATSGARMKKLMDEGKVWQAKMTALVALAVTLFVTFASSTALLASAESLGRIFTHDPLVLSAVALAMPPVSYYHAVRGLSVWVDAVLSAEGRPMCLSGLTASADYFIGIPLGLWLGFRSQWGLAGLWAGLAVSSTCSVSLGFLIAVLPRVASSPSDLKSLGVTEVASG